MLLLQQAGSGSLPLSNLSPEAFLGFLRDAEQFVLDQQINPVIVYWSSQQAKRLLPKGPRYRELLRDCFCVSVFSEDRREPPDEWCFLTESRQLCMVIYGQRMEDASGNVYQCAGSLDPQVVRQAFGKLLPIWQSIDVSESNRLEDACRNIGQPATNPLLSQPLRTQWPVVKTPSIEMPLLVPPQMVAAGSAQLVSPVSLAPLAQPLTPPQSQPGPAAPGGGDSELQSTVFSGAGLADGTPRFRGFADSPLTAPGDLVAPPGAQSSAPPAEQVVVIPPAAQIIIRDIIGLLRHSDDVASILQHAIDKLTVMGRAHRGLIWQLADGELAVTQEYSTTGNNCFVGQKLGSQDSTGIFMEFISRFPDESCSGVISVPDTHKDTKLHKMSPQLASLIELGDVRARLVAQLKCRGKFSGFLELQQCGQTRSWSEQDAEVLQIVAEMLSALVQHEIDQSMIESDAREMKIINQIANLFRESRGQRSHDVLVESVKVVASHLGFNNSQIYLYSSEDELLVPQMEDGANQPLDFSDKNNPFVSVYESGSMRVRKINVVPARKADPYFRHDVALIVPLVSEGEQLGVLGLWQRAANQPELRQRDEDLIVNISIQLATFIRADQAIAQVREDKLRGEIITRVANEIRNSLREVDQMLETLVESLQDHFMLGLCVVSLFDSQAQDFTKTKSAGGLDSIANPLAPNFGEQLFLTMVDELKAGKPIFLTRAEINDKLADKGIIVPAAMKMATLMPLIHGEQFKAALCMVSTDRTRPYPEKDMKMVADLADRVAVQISHTQLYVQVEQQAVTDPMTGLYNRRHFNEQLSKEIDRFQRHGMPFSYIIIDLDYLKKINDSLGHQFGDAAIKHIANVLKRQVRDVDTAARYGGEEFVILLPITEQKAARAAAERICAAIREKPVEGIGTITASIGTSTYPTDAQDRDTLTELADQALYLAKHRGRNQVCSVSEDLKPSLEQRKEEALEVQLEAVTKKTQEFASVDLKLIAEHGILGIMGAIVKIIEAKDAYDQHRSPRAAEFASKLAQELHLSREHVTIISLSAVLHNMGKIAMPQEILQKKGPLSEEERRIIQQSPSIGAKILEPARHLHRVAAVIEAYHEHWDGSGYPKGLKGEDIPLESRIISLVDAFIAMTSDRPYRQAMSIEQAAEEVKKGAGKEWDPRLVKLFLALLKKEARGQ
jgi:diguanylate cyclase (GGDEF)-like protein